jgi:hypothetical protein
MREPRHPVGPAFEKAANAMEAWRQQQIVALTETQRALYEQARRKSEERAEAKQKELAERRQSDIRERTQRKLLQLPAPVLAPGRRPVRLTEIQARQIIEEHYRHDGRPADATYTRFVRQAETTATREIDKEHEQQREAFGAAEREGHDEMLRSFAAAREAPPAQREPFARAAAEGHAKSDFEKVATNANDRSPAIARAIERVRKKEEEQRRDRDRERDPGRER